MFANTLAITKRVQEDWASYELSRPKLIFNWVKEDVKT